MTAYVVLCLIIAGLCWACYWWGHGDGRTDGEERRVEHGILKLEIESDRYERDISSSTREIERLNNEYRAREKDWKRITDLAEAVGLRWERCGETDGKWVKYGRRK